MDVPASLHTLMLGAMMACLQARWGVSGRVAPYARFHGDELELRLVHIMEHYTTHFRIGAPHLRGMELELDDARRPLERLVRAAGGDRAELPFRDNEVRDFARFSGLGHAFLDDLANHHLHTPTRILGSA